MDKLSTTVNDDFVWVRWLLDYRWSPDRGIGDATHVIGNTCNLQSETCTKNIRKHVTTIRKHVNHAQECVVCSRNYAMHCQKCISSPKRRILRSEISTYYQRMGPTVENHVTYVRRYEPVVGTSTSRNFDKSGTTTALKLLVPNGHCGTTSSARSRVYQEMRCGKMNSTLRGTCFQGRITASFRSHLPEWDGPPIFDPVAIIVRVRRTSGVRGFLLILFEIIYPACP